LIILAKNILFLLYFILIASFCQYLAQNEKLFCKVRARTATSGDLVVQYLSRTAGRVVACACAHVRADAKSAANR